MERVQVSIVTSNRFEVTADMLWCPAMPDKSSGSTCIDLFEDMISCGLVDLSIVNHVECLCYFMDVVQNNLDNFASFYYCHHIWHSRGDGFPAGIPDEL